MPLFNSARSWHSEDISFPNNWITSRHKSGLACQLLRRFRGNEGKFGHPHGFHCVTAVVTTQGGRQPDERTRLQLAKLYRRAFVRCHGHLSDAGAQNVNPAARLAFLEDTLAGLE